MQILSVLKLQIMDLRMPEYSIVYFFLGTFWKLYTAEKIL